MIAALYVETNGAYFGIDGVDPWDERRDARKYDGPYPVVAHPPCSRWCKPLAMVNQTRYGHRVGDDGGCFLSALVNVREFGGVLEHPANTAAWDAFHIRRPPRSGGWVYAGDGGWTCHVEQGKYGHPARKATWLYASAVELPDLRWGKSEARALTSYLQRTKSTLPRLSKKMASRTPVEFREVLLSMAATAAA